MELTAFQRSQGLCFSCKLSKKGLSQVAAQVFCMDLTQHHMKKAPEQKQKLVNNGTPFKPFQFLELTRTGQLQ